MRCFLKNTEESPTAFGTGKKDLVRDLMANQRAGDVKRGRSWSGEGGRVFGLYLVGSESCASSEFHISLPLPSFFLTLSQPVISKRGLKPSNFPSPVCRLQPTLAVFFELADSPTQFHT